MSPLNDYLGAIFLFGGNFSPPNYAFCDGSLHAIVDFTALYAVIGDYYGGDGRSSFGFPDYRGRALVGAGSQPDMDPVRVADKLGMESCEVQLQTENLPGHTHNGSFDSAKLNALVSTQVDLANSAVYCLIACNNGGGVAENPSGLYPGFNGSTAVWSNLTNGAQMHPEVITDGKLLNLQIDTQFANIAVGVVTESTGGGKSYTQSSIPPFLVANYLITIEGKFPPISNTEQHPDGDQ